MRLDKNIIDAVKAIGHDRLIIHSTGVYSCSTTPDDRFGQGAVRMANGAVVYGSKNIVVLGDIYVTAPYTLVDLKDAKNNPDS